MTPEEKARVKIDQMFEDAGQKVVDRDFNTPTLTAAAIREGLLEGNREADYFLFINGMAVGVLEAKRNERKWMLLLIKFANKQTSMLVVCQNATQPILVHCPSSTSPTGKRPSSETFVMKTENSLS